MDELTERLAMLSSAEDFLEFFSVPFDRRMVTLGRGHILPRFYQNIRRDEALTRHIGSAALYARYRALLVRAYEDFLHTTRGQEKAARLIRDADGRRAIAPATRASPAA